MKLLLLCLLLTGCATVPECPVCADYCRQYTDCADFRAWHHEAKD